MRRRDGNRGQQGNKGTRRVFLFPFGAPSLADISSLGASPVGDIS